MTPTGDDNFDQDTNESVVGSVDTLDKGPLSCPPFNTRTFHRQLTLDSLGRKSVFVAVLLGLLASWIPNLAGQTESLFIFVLVAVAWVGLNSISSRVAMRLNRVMSLLERQPDRAESELAQVMGRWPLYRPVRLLLYHRLAILRHRQGRFAESAAISRQLLGQNLGTTDSLASRGGLGLAGQSLVGSSSPASQSQREVGSGQSGIRAHLLLMLTEADLHENNLWDAWIALSELSSLRLNLIESLQRLALQTQYEVATQQHQNAIWQVQHKIRMAELMPAPQCGAMHALLEISARQEGDFDLATWLDHRRQLLATEQQLEVLGVSQLKTDKPAGAS
jgi:hypothetical protein